MSSRDNFFLKQALDLAKLGGGWTNPNPMVGAVLVKNGKVIGKGYHRRVGFPHAEIEALQPAKNPRGATLYLNLEPCNHYGRTPPCSEAIIKAGVVQVVCSTLDPNPKVHGRGVAVLRRAGIRVSIGGLEREARRFNEAFFVCHEKKRPFVALKFGTSLDGKIATRSGDSKWITNESARAYARSLRGVYQAVLVGIQTVIADDPDLGARQKGQRDPLRIILDPHLKISLRSRVLRDTNVLIASTVLANQNKKKILQKKGISVWEFPGETIPLKKFLFELHRHEIVSLLVEGGGETLGRFFDAKLVDKVYAFFAPIIIGGEKATSAVRGQGVRKVSEALKLQNIEWRRFGDNFAVIGYHESV